MTYIMRGSREGEGTGGPDRLKNHKNIGFPSNTGPDPLKFNVGPSSNGVSLAGR